MSRSLILWKNATLVTLRNGVDLDIISDGTLVVINDKLAWVGKTVDLPKEKFNDAISFDLNGKVVTPGFIDCHTHLVFGGNRIADWLARMQGEDYHLIHDNKNDANRGVYSTVKNTREISEEALYELALKRTMQCLKNGITTLEMKSGYGLSLDAERKILQIIKRLKQNTPLDIQATFLGAHFLAPEFSNKDDYLDYLIKDVLPILIQEKLVDAVDGFCDKIAFSEKQLDKLYAFAKAENRIIKIHADQLCETGACQLAEHYQASSVDHLEYITEEGVKTLKKAGTVAVLLPGAHYFLQQNKKPPIAWFRQYQVPMAIASDFNPGTSPTISLTLMMNMACVLWGLSPIEAFYGVTAHAAKSMGMSNIVGRLAPGMQADFVVWDVCDPLELIYYFGSDPTLMVVKRGEIVYDKIHSL